jgi:hypothetical protein
MLREYFTSEAEIAQLRSLPVSEALSRIRHERDAHIAWAQAKAGFLAQEVRPPPTAKPKPPITEIVRPRSERIAGTRLG